MSDLDATIADIRSRIAAAERARGRAELARDSAQAQADSARAQLQAEFGVTTVDEATQMLAQLEAELVAAAEQVRDALSVIGV